MIIKRTLSIFLMIVFITGTGWGNMIAAAADVSQSEEHAIFSDIAEHWAKNAIEEASQQKIVGGYPDGTFQPDRQIKREEFFTLLVNILTEKPDISKVDLRFSDVDMSEWYVSVIKTAVAAQMTSGYPDGTFGIGKPMTREEAALVTMTIIPHNASEDADGIETMQDHAKVSEWAYDAVDFMIRKGYMKGDSDGSFHPGTVLTRAEATQILLAVLKNEPIISASAQEKTDQQEFLESLKDGCASEHLNKNAAGELDVSEAALAKLPEGIFQKGSGSAGDPYQISTQEQLNHIRAHNKAGIQFQLVNDIEISKDFASAIPKPEDKTADWSLGNWTPIGNKAEPFQGTIDGNGYRISGLKIDNSGAASISSASSDKKKDQINQKNAAISEPTGLVGSLGADGEIKNLTIDDSTVNNIGSYTGVFAGSSSGIIRKCTVEKGVEVTGGNNTGGIAGYSEASIIDSTNRGEVFSDSRAVGGIVGSFTTGKQSALSGCENLGEIDGNDSVGGVVGYLIAAGLVSDEPAVQNCSNSGSVKGSNYYTGGIVGNADGSASIILISDCENKGTVSSTGVSGGIVGKSNQKRVEVLECRNEGEVEGKSAGGIIGSNDGLIRCSQNSGKIEGEIYVGGIVGFQTEAESRVLQCYNSGEIFTGGDGNNTGGIAGESDTTILNCYNTGNVDGANNVGGIAGKNEGLIGNVYNIAEITGDGNVGALAGRNAGKIENGFWLKASAAEGISGQGTTGQSRVYSVSTAELSGDQTIRTNLGQEKLLDALNTYNGRDTDPLWCYQDNYKYPQLYSLPNR